MSTRRGRRVSCPTSNARVALWMAGLVLLPLFALPGSAQVGARNLFDGVGSLPRFPADVRSILGPEYFESVQAGAADAGAAIMLSELRQIWQLYETYDLGTQTVVVVRSLDTLDIIKTFTLEGALRAAPLHATFADWLHATEPTRRLFFQRIGVPGSTGAQAVITAIDLGDFSTRDYQVPLVPGSKLAGLAYDPHDDRLLLLYGAQEFSVTASIYLRGLSLADGAVSRPRHLRSCNAELGPAAGRGVAGNVMYVANAEHLYLHCNRTGEISTFVRLPRAEALSETSTEDFTTGPTNAHTAIIEPGSGRVFNMTDQGAIWVFDTRTMAFVGTVAAHRDGRADNPGLGYGVDEATGRLYFQAPEFGLGVVDGRLFPVPQARSDPGLAAPGRNRILVDSVTGRIFVLPEGADGYTIYQPPPVVPAPPEADPDIGTVDRTEQPGVTESSFSASASGYGARVLMSKGVIPLFPMPGLGGGPANPGYLFTANTNAPNVTSACSFSDRDLLVARVAKTEADTGSTAASAIAADVDPRTKLDLEQPSRCDPSANNVDGNALLGKVFGAVPGAADALDGTLGPAARWNRDPASCSSSVGDEPKTGTPDDHGSPPLGRSGVQCAVPDGERVVTAQAEGSLLGADLTVGRSVSWTEIRREERGIVSTAHAAASDIEIGGLIRIAEVRSVATSVANGRPGKGPLSEHVVSISGLRIGDTTICAGECDAKQATDALNVVAAGRLQFRVGMGSADPGLQAGSPGGALTAVQKSPQRQFSDRALAGDDTSEVPALEMIRFNDNFPWGAARQVFQFAGVATSANYNILLLPAGGSRFDGGPSGADLGAGSAGELLPGTPGTEGTPGSVGAGLNGAALDGNGVLLADDAASGSGGVGGAVRDVVTAIGRGLRLVWGDPRQALLLFTAWLLLAQPVLLARRRRLLQRVWTA